MAISANMMQMVFPSQIEWMFWRKACAYDASNYHSGHYLLCIAIGSSLPSHCMAVYTQLQVPVDPMYRKHINRNLHNSLQESFIQKTFM